MIRNSVTKIEETYKAGDSTTAAIKKLSDSELGEPPEFPETKTSGEKQNERITSLSFCMHPTMCKLDEMIECIQREKLNTMLKLAGFLMTQRGILKADGVVLDLESLKLVAKAQEAYRQGMEASSSRDIRPAAAAVEDSVSSTSDGEYASGCVVS